MCGCVPLEELPLRPTVTWRSRCALSEVIDERNHSVLGAASGFIENHDWSAGTPLPSERCRCVGCDRARGPWIVVFRFRTVSLASSQDCVMILCVVASARESER